jgi:hypothetical protein
MMINVLFFILTLLAIGTAVWYAAFYESAITGATYANTYVYLSIGAAIIFAGLFASGIINRKQNEQTILLK